MLASILSKSFNLSRNTAVVRIPPVVRHREFMRRFHLAGPGNSRGGQYPVPHRAAGRRQTIISRTALLAGCLMLGAIILSGPAVADGLGNADIQTGGGCMEDEAGFGLNCNANDITIASVSNIVINDDGCAFPGDTVTFTADFEVVTNAARHDIGLWFSTDGDPNGDGSVTGVCTVATPAYAPDLPWLDLDGTSDDPGDPQVIQDTCGDIDTGTGGHSPLFPTVQLTVVCIDNDGDLKLDVPIATSWRQPGANELCTSPDQAFPGAPSKCKSDPGVGVDIDVPRWLTVKKTSVPETDVGFEFTATGGLQPGQTPFSLDTDPVDIVLPGEEVLQGVGPGLSTIDITVTETIDPDMWELESVVCSDVFGSTAVTDGVTITLDTNVIDPVCTFHNVGFDRGDAPASYLEAVHKISADLYMGGIPDVNDAGSFSDDATLDGADEDGTTFAGISTDVTAPTVFYNLGVDTTNNTGSDAILIGGLDLNCDGDFGDTVNGVSELQSIIVDGDGTDSGGECMKQTNPDPPPTDLQYCALSWGTYNGSTPLISAVDCPGTNPTFARIRISDDTGLTSLSGLGGFGEVEDYAVPLAASTTPVMVSDLAATAVEKGAVVSWTTVSELGAVAFRVERLVGEPGEAGSHWIRAHKAAWIPSRLQLQGGNYQVFDAGASAGETHSYRVVEQTRKGPQITYGPYDLVVAAGSADLDAEQGYSVQARYDYDRVAENLETRAIARGKVKAQARADSQASAQPAGGKTAAPDTLRMQVGHTGIHGLTVQELVDAFESDTYQIENTLRRGKFRLSSRGQDIPWYEQDGMLYFYGQGPDNQFSTTRTYWLYMKQNGVRMAQADVQAAAVSEQVFIDTRDHELDALWWLSLTTDPNSDYWFWNILSPLTPVLPVSLPVPAALAAEGELTLRLWGASNAEHLLTVRASDDDVVIGQVSFSGDVPYQTAVPLTLPAEVMGGDMLNLEVVLEASPSGDYSAVLVDGFEVSWLRNYDAVGGAIKYPADGVTSVTGFATDQVVTLNVIDPLAPVWVTGGALAPDGTGFSYSANLPLSEYASADASLILKPGTMELDDKSNLKRANNRADYVVISNAELMDAAFALSEYRSSDLKTMVVDIQDIYDEFTDGEPWPGAINEFAKASQSWKTAPRYMVILGDGSFDYRDITPTGYNFVSPQMYGTSNGLFASDTLQGDVNGDGIPEVAFGRVTVKSNAEGLAYVNKLSNYESGIGELPSLLLSDVSDKGGDFKYSTFQVGEEVSGNIISIYLQDTDIDTARLALDLELDRGVRMVNYLGHGGMDRLSGIGPLGLINNIDVADMNNTVTPSFIGLSCLINNYSIPGWDSLGERLVVKPDAGMVVSWAASGESYNDQATVLGVQFHSGQGNYERLGDAIIDAFQQKPYLVPIYTLLGDPALLLK